jgi:hypothetical protein
MTQSANREGGLQCLTLNPVGSSSYAMVVATVKAGGIGLLDQEFHQGGLEEAAGSLDKALQGVSRSSTNLGIRLRADQIQPHHPLLQKLAVQPYWVILVHWQAETITDCLSRFPRWGPRPQSVT